MTTMTKMKGVATAFSFAALMSVGGASLASAEDVTLMAGFLGQAQRGIVR